MKKLLYGLLLFSLITINGFSQILSKSALTMLDIKYGFRDAKFEVPIDSFKNMIKIEDHGNSKFYISSAENLKLGDFDLEKIEYFFYKGELASILIDTKGLINSRGVLKILQTTYSNYRQPNEYIEYYWWFGNKVRMSYDENSITEDAIIFISSIKMQNLKEKDEYESAKNAGNDL